MKKLSILTIINILLLLACTSNEKERMKEGVTQTNNKNIGLTSDTNKVKDNISFIDIQPYEGLSEEIVNYIYTEMCKVHPRVSLLKKQVIPTRAFYVPRKRYKADTLIAMLSKSTSEGHVTVGITHYDISTDNGAIPDWGVMGLGFQPGKACAASTYRLNKKKDIKQQYFKVVIHEIGHTQGLPHCPDVTCIMTDAKGKNTTETEIDFCKKCKSILLKKGFKLNKYFAD